MTVKELIEVLQTHDQNARVATHANGHLCDPKEHSGLGRIWVRVEKTSSVCIGNMMNKAE